MNNQDHKILEAMSTYGGSFVKSLAHTARLADSENYVKLKAAFPDLWESYAGFVRTNNTQMHLVSENLLLQQRTLIN